MSTDSVERRFSLGMEGRDRQFAYLHIATAEFLPGQKFASYRRFSHIPFDDQRRRRFNIHQLKEKSFGRPL